MIHFLSNPVAEMDGITAIIIIAFIIILIKSGFDDDN